MVIQTKKPNTYPRKTRELFPETPAETSADLAANALRTEPPLHGESRTLSPNTFSSLPYPARSGHPSSGQGGYPIRELVSRFLTTCRRASPSSRKRLSPRTIEYYENCLSGLVFFAEQENWPEVDRINRHHLQDFQAYLETEPCRWNSEHSRTVYKIASPATVHHYLKLANTFFRWCVFEGYIENNPVTTFRIPTPEYKDVQPYSDDEVKAMLAICQHDIDRGNRYLGVRNKAIISVFIDTGLRLTELADMKLSELDPQLQQVRVLGKGAKLRVVPINGEARKVLKLYLNQYREDTGGDDVWLTEEGDHLVANSIQNMVNRLKKRAGVTSGGGPHRFRHYFATRYLENGGDMNALRLLLGHSTLYMVLKYTQYVDIRNALESHAAYSPLDRLARGSGRRQPAENWGWGR